jgi:hypothetical protein
MSDEKLVTGTGAQLERLRKGSKLTIYKFSLMRQDLNHRLAKQPPPPKKN